MDGSIDGIFSSTKSQGQKRLSDDVTVREKGVSQLSLASSTCQNKFQNVFSCLHRRIFFSLISNIGYFHTAPWQPPLKEYLTESRVKFNSFFQGHLYYPPMNCYTHTAEIHRVCPLPWERVYTWFKCSQRKTQRFKCTL